MGLIPLLAIILPLSIKGYAEPSVYPKPVLQSNGQAGSYQNPIPTDHSSNSTTVSVNPSSDAKPPTPLLGWDLEWQDWQGLNYTLFGQRPRGLYWADDEEKPSFPALFMDRAELTGKFGGRVDLDAAFFVNPDGMGKVSNQLEVRRWRFHTTGDAIILVPFSLCCGTVILAGMPKSSVQGWQDLAYFIS